MILFPFKMLLFILSVAVFAHKHLDHLAAPHEVSVGVTTTHDGEQYTRDQGGNR